MSSSPSLAEILSKISDGVCVFDNNNQVSFVNEKASQILQGADPGFNEQVAQAAKDKIARRLERFHESLNRWFEHQTYPNADGGLTVISREITARHRLEEALRAS